MRRRVLALALALFVACFAEVASSDEPSRLHTAAVHAQPTTTEPPVEVESKVVERGPLKQPVDATALAQTGSDGAGELTMLGLALLAFGLVLVDLASPRQRAATR